MLSSTYDLASRKWDLTADSQTLQHRYNTAGQLISMGDTLLDASSLTAGDLSYTYDASGNRSTLTAVAANNSWTGSYEYDDGERLKRIFNGASTYRQISAYDPLSRPTGESYLDGSSVAYGYEPDDDIASVSHSYSGGIVTLGYTRNGAHQLLSHAASDDGYLMKLSNASSAYTANSLNQYSQIGSASPSYDLNGNLTGDGTWTYAYDEENRLRQASTTGTTAIYAYDPLGRRRSKTVNGTTTNFVSDGPNEILELTATGSRSRLFLAGQTMDDYAGVYQDSTASWSFFHTNHQGSVLFTTQAGAISERYRYGAYGESDSPATGNPIRYAGRYFDAETGLYYNRARYYSPSVGRFLQTDPIGYADDVNLYTYVKNDPLNNSDPDGAICIPCIGAAIGVSVNVYQQVQEQGGIKNAKLDNLNVGRIIAAGALGAAGGALAGNAAKAAAFFGGGKVAQTAAVAIAGGAVGSVGAEIDAGLSGKEVTPDVAIEGAWSGALDAVGGKLMGEALGAAGKTSMTTGSKTTVSDAVKSVMPSNGGREAVKEAFTGAGGAAAASTTGGARCDKAAAEKNC